MPETTFIIQCPTCGPHVEKANVSGDVSDEGARAIVRAFLTREHAAKHVEPSFKCQAGHVVTPPDWSTDNHGNDFQGCRQHNQWRMSRRSRSDG